MKIYVRSVCMCLKRALMSRRFAAAVLMTALLIALDLFPVFQSGIHTADGKTTYSYDLVELIGFSGFTMFLGFSFITAVLPYSGAFCEDTQNRFLIPFVKRGSPRGYAAGTAAACGISSFLCVFLAQTLCLGIYGLFVPVVGENFVPENYMYSLIQEEHYVLYLLVQSSLYALRSYYTGTGGVVDSGGNVAAGSLLSYAPVTAMLLQILLASLVSAMLGMLMFLLNTLFRNYTGTVLVSVTSCAHLLLGSFGIYGAVSFDSMVVPTSWINLGDLADEMSPFLAAGILAGIVAVLALIGAVLLKFRRIEVWE